MAIGGIIVGVTLKLMGAGQMTAGLEEVDIAYAVRRYRPRARLCCWAWPGSQR